MKGLLPSIKLFSLLSVIGLLSVSYRFVTTYVADLNLFTRLGRVLKQPDMVLKIVPSGMKSVYESVMTFKPGRYKQSLSFEAT